VETWQGVIIQTDVQNSTTQWKKYADTMAHKMWLHDHWWRHVLNAASRIDPGTKVYKVNQIGDMWRVMVSGRCPCQVAEFITNQLNTVVASGNEISKMTQATTLTPEALPRVGGLKIRTGVLWSRALDIFTVPRLGGTDFNQWNLSCLLNGNVEKHIEYLENTHSMQTTQNHSNTFQSMLEKERSTRPLQPINSTICGQRELALVTPKLPEIQSKTWTVCFIKINPDSPPPRRFRRFLSRRLIERNRQRGNMETIRRVFVEALINWCGSRAHAQQEFRNNWCVLSVEKMAYQWNLIQSQEHGIQSLKALFAQLPKDLARCFKVTLVTDATLYKLTDCEMCYPDDLKDWVPKSSMMGSDQVFERWVGRGQNIGARLLGATDWGHCSLTTDGRTENPPNLLGGTESEPVDLKVSGDEMEKRMIRKCPLKSWFSKFK